MLTGYLEVPDIPGESRRAEHEDQIDIHDVSWGVSRPASAALGSGRTQSSAHISDFTFSKYFDASSTYLALATMQGKSFDEIVFYARKDSGDAHLDYLKVTLTNCVLTNYSMSSSSSDASTQLIKETISIAAEKINVVYTVQADDHSAGDEHEIEYDVAAQA